MRSLRRRWRVLSAAIATSLLMIGWPSMTAMAADGPNIAAGRTAAASTTSGDGTARNVTDGDQSTYWEGDGKKFPQWVQSDLGSSKRVDQVVLKLPAGWESRKQTLSLQGSADGTSFATLKSSATYTFSKGAGNKVTVSFPATKARFVRANITGNTAGKKAQLSELEIYGPETGDTQA
ncbi:discoidin domain-containing protein, partial [Streptomyces sp. NPDC059873]|uniref:discoidin domain-containing protein n=1 Tax=Streptomyces sp. NPDC059873 TaxID=3346982 RepID=UPI0036592FAF